MRLVQFASTVELIETPPPQTEPQVEPPMVTTGQKRRMEQEKEKEVENYKAKERFVGKGSGKNNTIKDQEHDKDADKEEMLSDWHSA